MKKNFQRVLQAICVLTAGVIIGFTLICVMYALPTDRVSAHVQESGNELVAEGDYWVMMPQKDNTILDNFTDCIMLLSSAYSGDEGIIEKAAINYRTYQTGMTKEESCQVCGTVPEDQQNVVSYPRYWHGYMVVLKPLLIFLNLGQIRDVNMFVVLSFMVITCILLHRQKKVRYIIPYLLTCCFINPFTVSNSLQNSTVFHVTSIAVIVMLIFYEKKKFSDQLWMYFMIVGMMTSYVDFLTYPVVSMALPLMFYLIVCKESSLKRNLISVVTYSATWGVGYVGMWASKWILSSVLMGKNYITEAVESIMIRSGNVVGEKNITLLDVFIKLSRYLAKSSFMYLAMIFIFACAILLVITRRKWNKTSKSLMFLIISVYPYIWFTLTKNHSYIHTIFTYRDMSILLMGISCALLPMINWENVRGCLRIKQNGRTDI